MWIILAVGSAFVFGLAQLALKSATLKKCLDQYVLTGLYVAGALFFFAILKGKITFNQSHVFILFSIFIALGSYLGNWTIIKALQIGPKSLTAPILKLYLLPIIFMSGIFFHEKFDLAKIITIIFLFLGLFLIKYNPDEKINIKNIKWIFFVLFGIVCLFLRDGGLKITQELGINNKELLFFSFIICIIFTAITTLIISRHKKERPIEFSLSKHRFRSIYYGSVAGICSGLGLFWYSSALAIGPASLTAMIFSTRTCIAVIFSYFFLREYFTKLQVTSLILIGTGFILAGILTSSPT